MRTAIGLLSILLLLSWRTATAVEAGLIDDRNECRTALGRASDTVNGTLPGVLRVGSWNIMKEQREGSTVLHRHLSAEVDVFLTQEAVQQDPERPGTYFAEGYRRSDLQTGVATSTRFSVDVACALTFIEPWLRTPKMVLATRLPFAEQALLVVNLHAINFTLGSGAYRDQLQAINRLLEAHDGPVLVGGDLNNWNPWRERVLTEFAAEAGLTRVEFSPDWRSRHLGTPVDSALVRGLRVISASALPTTLSDHHPILVLLTASKGPRVDTRAEDATPSPGH